MSFERLCEEFRAELAFARVLLKKELSREVET
jgi:hypothetical protein